jgi:hypothetical protein
MIATALFGICLGALLLWLGWRNRKKVQASMEWPYVPGRIISASVREDRTQGDQETADTTSYYPVVEYEYIVEQQLYRGNRLSFVDKGQSSRQKALAQVQVFQPGSPVWVFYNPAKPIDCVLERTAHSNNFVLILGGIIFLISLAGLFKCFLPQ